MQHCEKNPLFPTCSLVLSIPLPLSLALVLFFSCSSQISLSLFHIHILEKPTTHGMHKFTVCASLCEPPAEMQDANEFQAHTIYCAPNDLWSKSMWLTHTNTHTHIVVMANGYSWHIRFYLSCSHWISYGSNCLDFRHLPFIRYDLNPINSCFTIYTLQCRIIFNLFKQIVCCA